MISPVSGADEQRSADAVADADGGVVRALHQRDPQRALVRRRDVRHVAVLHHVVRQRAPAHVSYLHTALTLM